MNKRIIIVGGMGPQASLQLHHNIIDRAIELGAVNGNDFPEIIHLSLPIQDFISQPTTMPAAVSNISRHLEQLYRWRQRPFSYCLQHGAFAAATA